MVSHCTYLVTDQGQRQHEVTVNILLQKLHNTVDADIWLSVAPIRSNEGVTNLLNQLLHQQAAHCEQVTIENVNLVHMLLGYTLYLGRILKASSSVVM